MLSIWASFAELPDPRTGNAQRHNLLDVLTIALNAVICGAESQPSCPAQGGGRMVCRSAIAGRTRTCEHRRRARPHRSAPPCGQPRRRLDAVGPPPSRRGEAAGPGHDRDGRGHRLARLIPAALWINTYGPLSCCDTANLSWDGLRVIPRLTAGIDDGVIVHPRAQTLAAKALANRDILVSLIRLATNSRRSGLPPEKWSFLM